MTLSKILRSALLLIVAASVLLGGMVPLKTVSAAESSFSTKTVDAGRNPSLSLDPGGSPKIAYCYQVDPASATINYQLRYAERSDRYNPAAAWSWVVVESLPTNTSCAEAVLQLDNAGTIHIAYLTGRSSTYEIKHATKSSASSDWTIQVVDSSSTRIFRDLSLALTPSGLPRIAFFDATNKDLMYAHYDGAAWQTSSPLDSAGDVGRWASLVISESGIEHIFYPDLTTKPNFKHAWRDEVGWNFETYDPLNDPISGGSVAKAVVMADESLHVLYALPSTCGTNVCTSIRYATKVGSTWQDEEVTSYSFSTGSLTDFVIAVSQEGVPSISYLYWNGSPYGNGVLYVWTKGTSGWTSQTLPQNYHMTSMEIDAQGNNHAAIFYCNYQYCTTQYAYRAAPESSESYTVSGSVHVTGGKPLPGVRLSDGQGHSALSGADGSFVLTDLPNGSYTISAEKRGYNFAAPSLAVNIEGGDVSGIGFTADLPPWTLIYVLDGDNDQDEKYPNIFNYIEAGTGNPGVNIVALWDRLGSGNSAYYWMKPDSDLQTMATYTPGEETWPQGELNMGDPAVLESFTAWAMDSFPATHYALILDDHGDGLAGTMEDLTMQDYTSSYDLLDLNELQTALLEVTAPRQKIDVLVANACLMGMVEDGYQFRDVASYYVASENVQYSFTTGYTITLNMISQNSTPLDVGKAYVNGYADNIAPSGLPYTMSVADLSKVGSLKAAIESLAGALGSEIENFALPIFWIRNVEVQRFYLHLNKLNPHDFYIDLYDFARLVKERFSDPEIQAAADGVMAAIQDNYVVYNCSKFSTAQGVSIFFPDMKSSFYDDRYDFSIGTNWDRVEGPDIQASIQSTPTPKIWGNFLADVFHQVDPNGPDNPNPPEPIGKQEQFQVFLPILRR